MSFRRGFGFGRRHRGENLLAKMFADAIGDVWHFDVAGTDASGVGDTTVNNATGIVNGRVLTFADASKVPELVEISGKQACKFTAPSDRLVHPFGLTVPQPGSITLCIGDSTTNTATAWCTGSGAGPRWQISVDSAGDIVMFASSEVDSLLNVPRSATPFVMHCEFNGANSKFYVDNVLANTGNAGTQGTNQFTLGALWDGTVGRTFNCYGAAFFARPTGIMTAEERTYLHDLLRSWAPA